MNFRQAVSLLQQNLSESHFPLQNLLRGNRVIGQDSKRWFYNACNYILNTGYKLSDRDSASSTTMEYIIYSDNINNFLKDLRDRGLYNILANDMFDGDLRVLERSAKQIHLHANFVREHLIQQGGNNQLKRKSPYSYEDPIPNKISRVSHKKTKESSPRII